MKHSFAHQSARYLAVGVVVYLIDIAIFVSLTAVQFGYLGANIVAKASGAGAGFVLHKQFTYAWVQKDRAVRQATAYGGVFLWNLALTNVLLWLLVGVARANPLLAKMLTDVPALTSSFLLSRYWVFRPV